VLSYDFGFTAAPAIADATNRCRMRKLELKRLRRRVRESRRVKTERRMIRGEVDVLMAEVKEAQKQFMFKSLEIGGDEQVSRQ
jgi:hypothetical protein